MSSRKSGPPRVARSHLRLAQTIDVLSLLIELGRLRHTSALTAEEYERQKIKLARSLAGG
jgi:hypothetical protein